MPQTLLCARGICKHYWLGENKTPALRDVDLQLQRGEFAALAGPSGSGKSTLLNIIAALDAPDGGQIVFDGTPLDFANAAAIDLYRRNGIGFIFQNFNLAPVLTAQENVEMALLNHALPSAEIRRKAAHMLDCVGLQGQQHKFPRHLSGGQQQRVAVARALVKNPPLVLADEPTASLDGRNALHLLDLLRELNAHSGTAFLISTHDPRLLDRLPRIIQMEDGKVCA